MESTGIYKCIAVLGILLFLTPPSNVQAKDKYLIYSSLKVTVGNYIGGGISLDVIRNNKYSLGIGFYEQEKKPGNRPPDYQKGILSLLTFGLGGARDNIQSASFTLGKVFYSKTNSAIRYHIKAGLTYSVVKRPTNWVKLEDVLFSMENYLYDYEKFYEPGILINPTIEVPLLKFLGFATGPYVLLNQKTISYGLELTYMIGYVRK